jgi:hypothetical protein
MMSRQNITSEHIIFDELDLAERNRVRIVNEIAQKSLNLHRLVLLCNTHDSYVSRTNTRNTEMHWQQVMVVDEDDAPPPYSLFSSPGVNVEEKECSSDSGDSSDDENSGSS